MENVSLDNFFVHEWAQFRYGLHEMHGFPGDDRFPAFRIGGGGGELGGYEMLANACTNDRLVYYPMYESTQLTSFNLWLMFKL